MDQLDPDPASTGHKNDASGPEDGVAVSPGAGSLDHPAGNSAGAGDDLTGAVAGLLGLAMARSSLPDLLTQVAGFAVQAIPGADGAGLTLLKRDRPDVVVFSAPFVQQVDDIQYGLDEGPCVTAAATGRTMRSGSLGTDHRWPLFGPQAGRLGVHSVLSLPLHAAGTVLGVLNVYSRPRNAFGGHATRRGEQFAVPAAVAVQNARILADAQRVAVNLQGRWPPGR
jgi:GAF domain-containing protein